MNNKEVFWKCCRFFSSQRDNNGEIVIHHCGHIGNKCNTEGNCTNKLCPLGSNECYCEYVKKMESLIKTEITYGELPKVKPFRNCTKERRFRRFKICVEYLEDFTDYELLQFQQFMGFVYDVKQSHTYQTFEYIVANPFWKSVERGCEIPEFGIVIKKDEHGNLSFSWSLP